MDDVLDGTRVPFQDFTMQLREYLDSQCCARTVSGRVVFVCLFIDDLICI